MKKSLTYAALVTAVAAALAAGCAGGSDGTDTANNASSQPSTSAPAEQATHNQADVTFVQGMIPHHEGAIEMADLTEGRTDNPDILDLAERIKQAQGPEIDQLNGWLDAWGVNNDMPGMDHGDMGHEMPGMGAEDMKKLEQANGAEFDRLFLELMIEHHQGAVDMSETVLDEGSNPEVKELAQQIIDAQEAEINEMRSLLEG